MKLLITPSLKPWIYLLVFHYVTSSIQLLVHFSWIQMSPSALFSKYNHKHSVLFTEWQAFVTWMTQQRRLSLIP
jgi:hypothetical protein